MDVKKGVIELQQMQIVSLFFWLVYHCPVLGLNDILGTYPGQKIDCLALLLGHFLF